MNFSYNFSAKGTLNGLWPIKSSMPLALILENSSGQVVDTIGVSPRLHFYSAPSGNTIYVDKNATGAGNGSSLADAFTTVQAGVSAAVANDLVLVAHGTYLEAVNSAAHDVTIRGNGDSVIINSFGLADDTFFANHRTTLQNIELKGAGTGKANVLAVTTITAEDCVLRDGYRGFQFNAVSRPTIKRCTIEGHSDHGIIYDSDYDGVVDFCLIENNRVGMYLASCAGNVKARKTRIAGNSNYNIWGASTYTGAAVFDFCILFAGGYLFSSRYPIDNDSATGTITVKNSVLLGNPRNPSRISENIIDGGGNIGLTEQSMYPTVNSDKYPVSISLCIDDVSSIDMFQSFCDLCEEFGFNATTFVNTQSANSEDWAIYATEVQNGHEIGSHSVTHPDLTSLSAQDLESELVNSKSAIEAGLAAQGVTYTVKSFACPGNQTNSTVQIAIKSAGYLGARGGADYGVEESHYISSAGIFKIFSINPYNLFGTTNIRRNAAALFEYLAAKGGFISFYGHDVSYGSDFSIAEWRILFEEIVKHPNITVMSMADQVDYLKTYNPSGDLQTVDDGVTYTRTLIDQSDYEYPAGSILRVSGDNPFAVTEGHQYGIDKNMVYSADFDAGVYHARDGFDIGPYQYGGGSKVYNHPVNVSGSGLTGTYTLPICPTLLDADQNNTIYSALFVPNEIDLSAVADTDWFIAGYKAWGIWDPALDALNEARALKACGA